MNCEQIEEYISELCDGRKIPFHPAQHIGTCQNCQLRLNEYLAIGAELRRLASLDEAGLSFPAESKMKPLNREAWWRGGLTTVRVPKMAFAVMLIAIVALSSGLVIERARAGAAAGGFLELKYKIPPTGKTDICVMRADGSQKDNLCDFVDHRRDGLLLMNTRVTANSADAAQLAVRAKYVSGAGNTEVNYSDALFKDIPEKLFWVEPGEKQEVQVAGLGTIELEAEYLDHIPPLVSLPEETLDPNPNEFRIVDPVLVRDNQVIANADDGPSIKMGAPDAALMSYVPGEGRYLMSITPFDGAVEGNVHLGRMTFSLEGHDYLLLTSMPITESEHIWVKHESDFKPSERMMRRSEARDDKTLFRVSSLRTLELQRIPH